MFNILPEDVKRHIMGNYKQRLLVVWLLCILFVHISFLVFLFPSYLFTVYEKKNLAAETEQIQNTDGFKKGVMMLVMLAGGQILIGQNFLVRQPRDNRAVVEVFQKQVHAFPFGIIK